MLITCRFVNTESWKVMRVLKPLSAALAVTLLAAGCSLFPTGPALSGKASRALAYQLGGESEALVIPVCDYSDSLAIGTPRVMRTPFRELTGLNDECGTLFERQRQPARLLVLTHSGELWSVIPVAEPEPGWAFVRARLDEAGRAALLADLKARQFEINAAPSPWLVPGAEFDGTAIAVEPLDDDADWSAATAFVEAVQPVESGEKFRPFNRGAARPGVYCQAEHSHVKPDYAPNAILTLDFAQDQPVRIGSKAEFSDPTELREALNVHLASGRYALVRIRLAADNDIFALEHSGIHAIVQNCSDHYGSDLLVELPDGTTFWRCSRCFSPE